MLCLNSGCRAWVHCLGLMCQVPRWANTQRRGCFSGWRWLPRAGTHAWDGTVPATPYCSSLVLASCLWLIRSRPCLPQAGACAGVCAPAPGAQPADTRTHTQTHGHRLAAASHHLAHPRHSSPQHGRSRHPWVHLPAQRVPRCCGHLSAGAADPAGVCPQALGLLGGRRCGVTSFPPRLPSLPLPEVPVLRRGCTSPAGSPRISLLEHFSRAPVHSRLQFLSVQKLRALGLRLVQWDIPQNFPRRRHAGSMAVLGRWVPGRECSSVTFSLSSCRGGTEAGLGSLGRVPNPFRDMV